MSFTTRIETRQISISFDGEVSLTEQSHAQHCDVHNIMKRFERTQMCDHVSAYGGEYADYIDGIDFHEAMNQISSAESMFESIPSSLRAEFGNDPGRFLTWIQDENNRDEITSKGFSTSHLPSLPPSKAPDAVLKGGSDAESPTSKTTSHTASKGDSASESSKPLKS